MCTWKWYSGHFSRGRVGKSSIVGTLISGSESTLTARSSKQDGSAEANGKKQKKRLKVCEEQLAYLELLVIWQLSNKEGKEQGQLRASIFYQHLTLTGPLGPSLGATYSCLWRQWVTVPATTACRPPRSGRWHCTGRWQTGRHWLPRSESAGSGEFWLHEQRELKALKGEICNVHVSFWICLQFWAFPFCLPLKKILLLLLRMLLRFHYDWKGYHGRLWCALKEQSSQAFWDRTKKKEDILLCLLCKLS